MALALNFHFIDSEYTKYGFNFSQNTYHVNLNKTSIEYFIENVYTEFQFRTAHFDCHNHSGRGAVLFSVWHFKMCIYIHILSI